MIPINIQEKNLLLIVHAYSMLFILVCSLIASIVSYRNRRKFPELKFFHLYPFASFIELIISDFIHLAQLPMETRDEIIVSLLHLFLITEFLLIYHFFIQVLQSHTVKKIMLIIALIYLVVILLSWILTNRDSQHPYILYILQAVAILIPGFYYFVELFKNRHIISLTSEPSFWIATGAIFFFACSLPLFIMTDFILLKMGHEYEMGLYSINFFCYGIFFLLITKAYLCKNREA